MYILIVKPVGWRCNLRCEYCFYGSCPLQQASEATTMNDETLTRVITEGLAANPQVAEFDWLGGEPLMAGLPFYQRVVDLQRQHRRAGQRVINRVQTNGVLLDSTWAQFFSTHGFTVGVSLDGPPRLHDHFRRDEQGRGTADKVMKAIELLRQYRVYHGVICVVNSHNVHYPESVFNFFVQSGIHRLAFNHAKGLADDGQPLPTTVSPAEYAEFMCRIFDLWLARDNQEIVIRQFKSILHSFLGGRYRMCVFSDRCHTLFGVEHDGEVYPCEDHPGEDWLSFGNIHDGLDSILNHPNRQRFMTRVASAKAACHSCRWWDVCQGGCPRDYYLGTPAAVHRNRMCQAHRTLFTHVQEKIKPFVRLDTP